MHGRTSISVSMVEHDNIILPVRIIKYVHGRTSISVSMVERDNTILPVRIIARWNLLRMVQFSKLNKLQQLDQQTL